MRRVDEGRVRTADGSETPFRRTTDYLMCETCLVAIPASEEDRRNFREFARLMTELGLEPEDRTGEPETGPD